MHLIGFGNWQVMWNWRGWRDSWGETTSFGRGLVGEFFDLWWLGPFELWHQK